MRQLFALVFLCGLVVSSTAIAQDDPILVPDPSSRGLDAQIFHAIYDVENPVYEATLRGVNQASLKIFIAAVPASGLGEFLAGGSGGPTGRLALSEIGAAGLTMGLKNIFRRARPYVALDSVSSRQGSSYSDLDPFSFPSGHSALAFALATSTSLDYPEWYVIAPAMTWATLTAIARVWHGMHYPSDIAVGAILGVGSALLVHELFGPVDGENLINPPPPAISFVIPL